MSEAGDGVNFERFRRITGYLVGTMDRWNDAKRAEERDRVKHSLEGKGHEQKMDEVRGDSGYEDVRAVLRGNDPRGGYDHAGGLENGSRDGGAGCGVVAADEHCRASGSGRG